MLGRAIILLTISAVLVLVTTAAAPLLNWHSTEIKRLDVVHDGVRYVERGSALSRGSTTIYHLQILDLPRDLGGPRPVGTEPIKSMEIKRGFGFPVSALTYGFVREYRSRKLQDRWYDTLTIWNRTMPTGVHAVGLLIDFLFMQVIVLLIYEVALLILRRKRFRSHQCPDCKYPFGDNTTCSECGSNVTAWFRLTL
jgi:hypothetical protein